MHMLRMIGLEMFPKRLVVNGEYARRERPVPSLVQSGVKFFAR